MAKENFLSVVVRRGTLVVDKVTHAIGAEVKLLEEEAKRLIGLGVVGPVAVKGAAPSAPASASSSSAAPAPGAPSATLGADGPQLTSSDGPSVTQTQA
jgi:hypothetical protein